MLNCSQFCPLRWATLLSAVEQQAEQPPAKKIAAVVTVYNHNSHADVIVSRLLESYTLDGQGERPALELVSLYVDQAPANDKSRQLAYFSRHSPLATRTKSCTCRRS